MVDVAQYRCIEFFIICELFVSFFSTVFEFQTFMSEPVLKNFDLNIDVKILRSKLELQAKKKHGISLGKFKMQQRIRSAK